MNTPELGTPLDPLMNEKLDALRDSLALGKFQGYPDNTDRLVLPSFDHDASGRVIIPDGPWSTDQEIITPEQYRKLQNQGLAFDSQNRPLHPLFKEMVQDPAIGVVTGRGFLWNFGPNETADAAVIRRDLGDEPWILLIQRGDNKQLALIGGFLEGKTALETAIAEPEEEALINLREIAHLAIHAYSGAVADIRTTAHAWIKTQVFVFELPDTMAQRHRPGELVYDGGDDADKAFWVPFSHAEEFVQPAHKLLIRAITPLVSAQSPA